MAMMQDILDGLRDRGLIGAFAPISRMEDLMRDVEELKNGDFHTDHIDWIVNNADKSIPDDPGFEPRSLLTAVAFSPKMSLRFTLDGNLVDCILPPTYAEFGTAESKESDYVVELLKRHGYGAKENRYIPQKMLAVHCGLGRYGRNNIFYSDVFGSYAKIYTFITDMPCGDAPWHPLRRMESCDSCGACVAACPTNAIDENRRIVNADICITAFNERDRDFPDWLDKGAHNALVGCVKCQDCCPRNAGNIDKIVRGAEFTEAETRALLAHKKGEPLPDGLSEKLESNGIWKSFIQLIPRNLSALLGDGDRQYLKTEI